VILAVSGFSKNGQGKIAGPDGNEMDTEEFLASLQVSTSKVQSGASLPFNVVTQKYGKGIVQYGKKSAGTNGNLFQDICDEEGTMYLNIDLETYSPTAGFSTWSGATALAGSDFVITYRQYDTLEFEDAIGEVSFDLESVTVSVTERKLRATWSPELAQDDSAFHNIDAEAELTALLSEQIAAEVDREILRDLRKGAAWKTNGDYNERKYGNKGST